MRLASKISYNTGDREEYFYQRLSGDLVLLKNIIFMDSKGLKLVEVAGRTTATVQDLFLNTYGPNQIVLKCNHPFTVELSRDSVYEEIVY